MAKKRQKKEPTSTDQINAESLVGMMLNYHKALAKEAREDKKALRAAQKLALAAKATKLALNNARIDQMKAEAAERFDHAMCAARAAILMGIARGDADADGDWTITVPRAKGRWKPSDQTQEAILQHEKEIHAADERVKEARDEAEAARDRWKAAADSLQKFLDILRNANFQI